MIRIVYVWQMVKQNLHLKLKIKVIASLNIRTVGKIETEP
jgi:hypothetical protein